MLRKEPQKRYKLSNVFLGIASGLYLKSGSMGFLGCKSMVFIG
jgi:hypothetical protein